MFIPLPTRRCYYASFPTEQDVLLCWIPAEELQTLSAAGRIDPGAKDMYPQGVEIEVSEAAFRELKLNLGVSPMELCRQYRDLAVVDNGMGQKLIDGSYLEGLVRANEYTTAALDRTGNEDILLGPVPSPPMSPGDPPLAVFRHLAQRRERTHGD
jgi:hypothetical protein